MVTAATKAAIAALVAAAHKDLSHLLKQLLQVPATLRDGWLAVSLYNSLTLLKQQG
jgi:hypothetical protein